MNQATRHQWPSWTVGLGDGKEPDRSCPDVHRLSPSLRTYLGSRGIFSERLSPSPTRPGPPWLFFTAPSPADVLGVYFWLCVLPVWIESSVVRECIFPLSPLLLGQSLPHCRCSLYNLSSLLKASIVFQAFLHLLKEKTAKETSF